MFRSAEPKQAKMKKPKLLSMLMTQEKELSKLIDKQYEFAFNQVYE